MIRQGVRICRYAVRIIPKCCPDVTGNSVRILPKYAVARDLGIAHSNLRRWRAQYGKKGELAFPGNGKQRLTPQEEEVRRLKKELYEVQQERDILKKALAIFTKKP